MKKCTKCTQFDQETKARVLEIFGPDEVAAIATAFINQNNHARLSLQLINRNNGKASNLRAKVHYQQTIDFTGPIIGKCFAAMEAEALDALMKGAKKAGITLNIQHETCPHQEDAEGKADGVMEGDFCNRNGCKGEMRPVENDGSCSCHINPPCGSCTTSIVSCNECHTEVEPKC